MKKIKLFLCVALFGAMSFGAYSAYDYITMTTDEKFLFENIQALTQEESGNGENMWFSNLRWVECPISKVNGPAAFYYKGVLIGAYATYTYYGSKKCCEREFTTNVCYLSDETPCS